MDIPAPQDLPKKPLAEVIFEYRWGLQATGQPGAARDPGFRLMLGRFYDRVKEHYPTLVDLPAAQAPQEMLPYVVRHQLRSLPTGWPIVQLGPGILTVNETEGYTWPDFSRRTHEAVDALKQGYPKEVYPLRPVKLVLRYINALHPPQGTPLLRFVREKLHLQIAADPLLFDESHNSDEVAGINIGLSYPLRQAMGTISITVAQGHVNNQPALIWQLEATSPDVLPQGGDSVAEWLSGAHQDIEKWFLTMSRGTLFDEFGGKQ